MAKHLLDKTGWLKTCQKRSEKLAAILWIYLKITGSCHRGHKQLFIALSPLFLEEAIMALSCSVQCF